MKKNDILILSHLRNDARKSLVDVSKTTGIPASTIYDRVNENEKKIIKKYTAILNFPNMGFHSRVYAAIKINDDDKRKALGTYLQNHPAINTLYKVNMGYHYLFDGLFRNLNEADIFINTINRQFEVNDIKIFTIVDEVKKEEFLTKPEHLE